MFGLIKELNCKKCGATTVKIIGVTNIFRVNDSTDDYIPIKCNNCNELHYITENSACENSLVHNSEVSILECIGTCMY